MIYGRSPKLSIDSVFQPIIEKTNEIQTPKPYIEQLRENMKITQDIIRKHTDQARIKQKSNFDRKAKASQLATGDTVLVKILKHERKHKIEDKYEQDKYEVIEQIQPDISMFRIRSERRVEKVIHRNHLLPLRTKDFSDTVETCHQHRKENPKLPPRKNKPSHNHQEKPLATPRTSKPKRFIKESEQETDTTVGERTVRT